MEDINYIKDRFCQFKCPYRDNSNPISIGKVDHEFDCYECGESNELEVNQVLDELCQYCQVGNFIEEVRSYGIKI